MDYSKSGTASLAKAAPRHLEHNQAGQPANPFGRKPSRNDLLERMKAAAAERAAKAQK